MEIHMTHRGLIHAGTLLALLLSLVSCSPADRAPPAPIELARDTACSLDGMLLMDYPGPKAQIQYNEAKPDFFCDTVEMFAVYLRPELQTHVRALYVQDMGTGDWNNPAHPWIDARLAFYVYGSSRRGSMGPTLASFSREEPAKAFALMYGGKVYGFAEITRDMVRLDGGVLRDQRM
jgi:copper chaperone NosL